MPGILGIIEDVAADPDIESSVAKLLSGLVGHLKDALATNNSAAVAAAADQIVENTPQLSAAVTANTPVAPPEASQTTGDTAGTEAGPTTGETGEEHHDGDAA
jgi:cell division septation protein DedD